MGYYDRSILTDIEQLEKMLSQGKQLSGNSLPKSLPLQQITYGAPGTGKSYDVDAEIKRRGMVDIRTTFHPDTDYSTFVGAYKPQMEKVIIRDDRGFPVKENGAIVYEKKIVYKYTQQAFLKAYIAAWKDLHTPHVLVIEEINRGNCAQIFGDLFQLLDRNEEGFSSYPISPDSDITQELFDEFEGLSIKDAEAINALYKEDVMTGVLNGTKLLLPNNLYIWATMNTSDQSLFPIDSAFKRRWEWKYVPISNAKLNWVLCINGVRYDWWSFVEKINKKIGTTTQSEDKKLGYFFCKATKEDNVISADKFVGKVLFYIYNDVYKDYGFDDEIFKDKDDAENPILLFKDFYNQDGTPREAKIEIFLKNLGIETEAAIKEGASAEQDDSDNSETHPSLKVIFDDETIERESSFDTYLDALRKIGLEKVEPIAAEKEFNRYDCPLVSVEQFEAIKNSKFTYVEVDGYNVVQGLNKSSMMKFLKLLGEKLNINIEVE